MKRGVQSHTKKLKVPDTATTVAFLQNTCKENKSIKYQMQNSIEHKKKIAIVWQPTGSASNGLPKREAKASIKRLLAPIDATASTTFKMKWTKLRLQITALTWIVIIKPIDNSIFASINMIATPKTGKKCKSIKA